MSKRKRVRRVTFVTHRMAGGWLKSAGPPTVRTQVS